MPRPVSNDRTGFCIRDWKLKLRASPYCIGYEPETFLSSFWASLFGGSSGVRFEAFKYFFSKSLGSRQHCGWF